MEMGAPLKKLDEEKLHDVTGGEQVVRLSLTLNEYIQTGRLWASSGSHKKAQKYLWDKS